MGSPNDIVVSWLRLQDPNDWVLHKYWRYIWRLSIFTSYGWAYVCTLKLLYF
jgi:hypothetical protein